MPTSTAFYVGSLKLQVVADGTMWMDPRRVLPEAPEEEFNRLVTTDQAGEYAMSVQSLLLESAGKAILIDTGYGTRIHRPGRRDVGHLLENLNGLGLQPGDIDVVINTHAHVDHVGWNTYDRDGGVDLTFPNATYYMLDEEYAHYTQAAQIAESPTLEYTLVPLGGSGHLELAQDGTEITPEVRIFRSPGHTAGHICVAITSGAETAVFLGDLTHHPAEITHPEWTAAFDALPPVLTETRRKLIREAAEKDMLLITAHHVFPGAGRLVAAAGGYAWKDEPVRTGGTSR
jgi:glyoxylase-like metal-dependent hydrolase (beta-lactamase superfamily II)